MNETELENNLACALAGLLVDDLPWEFETKPFGAWARLSYWNSVIEVHRNHRDDLGFLVIRAGQPLTPKYQSLKVKKNQTKFKDYCMTARAARGLTKGKKAAPPPDTIPGLIEEIDKLLMDPKPSNVSYNCGKARKLLKKLKELIEKEK